MLRRSVERRNRKKQSKRALRQRRMRLGLLLLHLLQVCAWVCCCFICCRSAVASFSAGVLFVINYFDIAIPLTDRLNRKPISNPAGPTKTEVDRQLEPPTGNLNRQPAT